MESIDATYENGTLKLDSPLPLPNSTRVSVTVNVKSDQPPRGSLEAVYEVLGRRHDLGPSDLAARIDEHQP